MKHTKLSTLAAITAAFTLVFTPGAHAASFVLPIGSGFGAMRLGGAGAMHFGGFSGLHGVAGWRGGGWGGAARRGGTWHGGNVNSFGGKGWRPAGGRWHGRDYYASNGYITTVYTPSGYPTEYLTASLSARTDYLHGEHARHQDSYLPATASPSTASSTTSIFAGSATLYTNDDASGLMLRHSCH